MEWKMAGECSKRAHTELPKSNSRSGGHVKGVDLMGHGDAHHIVGTVDSGCGQSVALGAHDDGQTGLGHEARVVEWDGIVGQGHGGCTETIATEVVGLVDPGPGHQEHTAHGDAYSTTVQGVAGIPCEQDGIDA